MLQVHEKYPEIEYSETIVDNACMQLVKNPAQFDVLVSLPLSGQPLILVLGGQQIHLASALSRTKHPSCSVDHWRQGQRKGACTLSDCSAC